MAIHFSFKHPPLCEFFPVRQNAVRDRASARGVNSSDLSAYAELRRTVDDLQEEISLQMRALGELVYATHCGTPSDSDELQKILEYIDDLRDEIKGHEEQMTLLRGTRRCPGCNHEIADAESFCENCGHPIENHIVKQS